MTIPRCDLQDYLEIACLFHYEVEVTLRDGQRANGVAKDVFSKQGKEILLLNCGEETHSIETAELHSMHVITAGARFTEVTFT